MKTWPLCGQNSTVHQWDKFLVLLINWDNLPNVIRHITKCKDENFFQYKLTEIKSLKCSGYIILSKTLSGLQLSMSRSWLSLLKTDTFALLIFLPSVCNFISVCAGWATSILKKWQLQEYGRWNVTHNL